MKMIICFLFLIAYFSNTLMAADNNDKNYEAENIVGVSHSITQYDNKTLRYFQLRYQISYEINDFPLIPYLEPDVFIGLSQEKPNLFVTVLFGMKKNLLERQNLILSFDMGSGIAIGLNDKDNAGVIGRIGFDIAYKNLVLRAMEINLISGFIFNGTVSIGLSYKF